MEEDDDNFLNSVLEFGDGTLYNIPPPPSSLLDPAPEETVTAPVDGPPVTKEERFEDDFDRSWPRSKQSPAPHSQDLAPQRYSQDPVSPALSQLHSSPQETSRVLFNERSNKLEPYTNSYRPQQGSYPRKGSTTHSDSTVHSSDAKSPRESSQVHNVHALQVHVLQKHHGGGTSHDHPTQRGGNLSSALPGSYNSHRSREKDVTGHESLPHPPFDSKRSRDKYASFGVPSSQGPRERESLAGEARGRRLSNAGPPVHNGSLEDEGSFVPPISQATPSPSSSRRAPSQDHNLQPPSSTVRSVSPTHSRASAVSPTADLVLPSGVDLDEARRDVMHTAAERARIRRQQEEEERAKARERARKKAAELEAKMKEAEEKTKLKETIVSPEVGLNLLVLKECRLNEQHSNMYEYRSKRRLPEAHYLKCQTRQHHKHHVRMHQPRLFADLLRFVAPNARR
jgi:serine/arginine repetitive matrix protein 2